MNQNSLGSPKLVQCVLVKKISSGSTLVARWVKNPLLSLLWLRTLALELMHAKGIAKIH